LTKTLKYAIILPFIADDRMPFGMRKVRTLSFKKLKKAVGNSHRFGGNVRQGKAAQRQYYPDFVVGKGEKRMEVLVLGQSHHTPLAVRRVGAKPCWVQEQPLGNHWKSSLAKILAVMSEPDK